MSSAFALHEKDRVSGSPFELRGEFAGFIRNVEGKRRMLVRTPEGDLPLKVPRDLRERLFGSIAAGQEVIVSGLDCGEHGKRRRIVLRVQVVEAAELPGECFTCPIRVCAKKNCWKQGGRELWQSLEKDIALASLEGLLVLEAVDCLDRCKQAPNLDCGAIELERCSREDAHELVSALGGLGRF